MTDSIPFLLLIQLVLILLNAVFASAEIAVLSLNELRLQKLTAEGSKGAGRLSRLVANPAKFLATIQVAITLSGFLGSAFAAENFSGSLTESLMQLGLPIPRKSLETISVVLITLILSYVTLIFGELVPKRIAMKKSEQLAMALSGLITGLSGLFTPVVWLLSVSTNAVLRLVGIDPGEEGEEVSEEEIRMMVDAGSEKGAIDHEEKTFIQNVFEFDDLTAGEIATHRTDTDFLAADGSIDEWEQIIHSTRHTLYPVCGETPDDVLGVLNAKDYFRLADRSRNNVMEQAVRPAYFVPESLKADVLFRNMKEHRRSMAIVLDEYGGMMGLITRNDLLEQLVGSLADGETAGEEEPSILAAGEGEWLVTGNVPLKDIQEATGLPLEDDRFDTFTGLVFDRLGMIPGDGRSRVELELDGLSVTLTHIEDHQICEAVLKKRPE